MKHIIYHILIPAIMPVVFFRIATLPVEVWGCVALRHPINKNIRLVGGRTRGLIALLIAFVSGLAAMGLRDRRRGDKDALWWVASAIILTIPVVALLILA